MRIVVSEAWASMMFSASPASAARLLAQEGDEDPSDCALRTDQGSILRPQGPVKLPAVGESAAIGTGAGSHRLPDG